jgi:hypothetical protein
MKNMTLGGGARRWLIVAQALAAAVPVAPFVMGCSKSSTVEAYWIDIRYDGDCPDKLNQPTTANVKRGQRVEWQSVVMNGSTPENVYRDYSIHFDPFVGKTTSSDDKGKASSKPINMSAVQDVDYKYTVVSPNDTNGNPTCPPLDPRLRVDRT